jgi:hypothetical protein
MAGNESLTASEFYCSSGEDSSDVDEFVPGTKTIPLHSFLARGKDHLITAENRRTFEQTPETVMLSVEEWGPSIGYVKDEFITYELCKLAVENHSGSILSIEPRLLTKEEYYALCLQSVSDNGWNMKFIPKKVQTQELVDAAIQRSCWAIKHVKQKFKTYDNCISAVKRNGQTLEYVPKQFINAEMCELAAQSQSVCLHFIPPQFLTQEICRMAVKANGENVKHVPDHFMSTELAWLAITSPDPSDTSETMCGANIQYISAKYLTKDIIVHSAKLWYPTIGRVPKECFTEDLEDALVEVSPLCIKFVKQTPERCMKALKQEPCVFESSIHKESLTREMVEYFEALPNNIKENIKRFMKAEHLAYAMSLLQK